MAATVKYQTMRLSFFYWKFEKKSLMRYCSNSFIICPIFKFSVEKPQSRGLISKVPAILDIINNNKGVRAKKLRQYLIRVKVYLINTRDVTTTLWEMIVHFGHNFLNICPIFKLFVSNFQKDYLHQLGVLGFIRGLWVIWFREINNREITEFDCTLVIIKMALVLNVKLVLNRQLWLQICNLCVTHSCTYGVSSL